MSGKRRMGSEEEMTSHLKGATALHILRKRRQVTTAELAAALGCHPATAYRVMMRLVLSRKFSIGYERPYWFLRQVE